MEIRPTYLVMVTGENNNKYYNLFPEGSQFRVEYGRIDATKTTRTYPISKWEFQIKSKLKKGYQDITDLKKDLVEEISSTNPDSPYREIENAAIRAIVEELQRLARETIQKIQLRLRQLHKIWLMQLRKLLMHWQTLALLQMSLITTYSSSLL